MPSPSIVQYKKQQTSSVKTLTSPNMDATPLAGNFLQVIARGTANAFALYTVIGDGGGNWIANGGAIWSGSGTPILFMYRTNVLAGGQVPFTLTVDPSGVNTTLTIEMWELTNVDPSTPCDTPDTDTSGNSGNTSLPPLVIASPSTTVPGLEFAAIASNSGPGSLVNWSDGFSVYPGTVVADVLQVATLTHDGSGPFTTTPSWTPSGSIMRAGLVNWRGTNPVLTGVGFTRGRVLR